MHILKIIKRGKDNFWKNTAGTITIETALLSSVMISLTGASFEAGLAYWQWNSVQQAARIGGRIAAISPPVAQSLNGFTGLSGNIRAGDPMPDYLFECTGSERRCNSGQYDDQAMSRLLYGLDNDGECAAAQKSRRGMCDVFGKIGLDNIRISYENSGHGRAGNPADPVPLIQLTVTGLRYNFVFLDILLPEKFSLMPDITVSQIAEDLS